MSLKELKLIILSLILAKFRGGFFGYKKFAQV